MSSNIAQAGLMITLQNYEEAYNLLKNENRSRPKVLSMLGESCFFTGRFEEALEVFNKLFIEKDIYLNELGCSIDDYDNFGREIHNFLISLSIHNLPQNVDYNCKQSIEKSDEQYPELDYISELKSRLNTPEGEVEKKAFINQIFKDIKSDDNIKRGRAYFNLAEIHFGSGNLNDAFSCYFNAAHAEPSKALYYGYAAQTMLRLHDEKSMRLMVLFTRRAIDLDPTNARWHMLHGSACFHLSQLIDSGFINHANFELKNALNFCREDQVSLKNAINRLISGINS